MVCRLKIVGRSRTLSRLLRRGVRNQSSAAKGVVCRVRGKPHKWNVVEFCAPWFQVVLSDGDSADYTGHELAPLLDFSENDFYDSRLRF